MFVSIMGRFGSADVISGKKLFSKSTPIVKKISALPRAVTCEGEGSYE